MFFCSPGCPDSPYYKALRWCKTWALDPRKSFAQYFWLVFCCFFIYISCSLLDRFKYMYCLLCCFFCVTAILWVSTGVSPMFTRPCVPQSLRSPLYDISPYVSHVPQSLCYSEMFPSPVAPQTYITQSLCSPVPMFPIFHSPFVSQSLYMFTSPYAP